MGCDESRRFVIVGIARSIGRLIARYSIVVLGHIGTPKSMRKPKRKTVLGGIKRVEQDACQATVVYQKKVQLRNL